MSVFSGLTDGIKKGLQYDLDMGKLLIWAVTHGNAAAVHDCVAVEAEFVNEATGGGAGLISGIEIAVLTGDPFAGSRAMAQAALAKWGHH